MIARPAIIVLLACLLLGLTNPAFAQGPRGQAPQIGFVNVQKVIYDYNKTAEITRRLEKKLKAHDEVLRQKKDRLRARMAELEDPDPDLVTDEVILERVRLEKEIALEKVDIDLDEKNHRIQLEQELVAHMKKVYEEVCREVQVIARDRGLWAVFMVAEGEIEGRTRGEVSSNILVRPVLWHDESADLTAELIQRLNS